MSQDDQLADLLGFVLAGRPERVTHALAVGLPREAQGALGTVADAAAAMALAAAPVVPSPGVRARILESVRRRGEQGRRAILVMDMINDHLTPGRPLEVPRAREIVPALQARLDRARTENTPVVYVLDRHEENDADLEEWGVHAVAGTEGADVWAPLAPQAGDRVVTKGSYSGFFNTELQCVLSELSVDTLEITGCLTEMQMFVTATDALQRGFAVDVPAAFQAGSSADAEQAALGVLAMMRPYAPARKALLAQLEVRV